jgi:hypothetical protein
MSSIIRYCEELVTHLNMVQYHLGNKLAVPGIAQQILVIPGHHSQELDHQCAPS